MKHSQVLRLPKCVYTIVLITYLGVIWTVFQTFLWCNAMLWCIKQKLTVGECSERRKISSCFVTFLLNCRKAALHVVTTKWVFYLIKRWTTGGHFKDGKLPNHLLFLNSFQPFSASACCLKWGSYLSMLEAWLAFISGFQETHLKQSINSVPNRVAISVERSKI